MKHLHFLLMLLTFILTGCSGGKQAHTSIVVNVGQFLEASFPGGAVLLAKNLATGEVQKFDLAKPYSVVLPYGEWSLYVVGAEGSSNWVGPYACGAAENVKFTTDQQRVQIQATTATCTTEPFASLLSTKIALWDVARWDQANWL